MSVHRHTPSARVGTLPQLFGRYLLIERLSRGGMGEIFLARLGISGFEKAVVIKKILPHLAADQEFIGRFVDEALVAVKLQHANIAQVFEVGRKGDEYFLAIEHVDGKDLRRTLTVLNELQRRMPPDIALFIAREVANGLAYAHRRMSPEGKSLEVVHCDISPPNVMMSYSGETKIIDFGIAKSAMKMTETNPHRGFGKFGYMSPEQLIRGAEIDHRTDIYATGAVLYEMLTGQRLYTAGQTPDYRALAKMVTRGQHPIPSEIDEELAPYDELVRRALRPEADDRYESAAEFRDEIQRVLVAINPTISADDLSEFMRSTFTEEVNEHEQVLAALDRTDLELWENELTLQPDSTVSFALADDDLIEVHGTVESTDVETRPIDVADSVIAAPVVDAKRIKPIGFALGALALIGIGAGLALMISGGDGATERPSAPVAATDQPVTVPPDAATVRPLDIVVAPLPPEDPPDAGTAIVAKPRDPPKKEGNHKRPVTNVSDRKPPQPTLNKKTVRAHFRAAQQDYKEFKKKYGSRLEADWNDLALFVTFVQSSPDKLAEFDQKISRFRSKMRRESGK